MPEWLAMVLIPVVFICTILGKMLAATLIADRISKDSIFYAVYKNDTFVSGSFSEDESRNVHDALITEVNGMADIEMRRVIF